MRMIITRVYASSSSLLIGFCTMSRHVKRCCSSGTPFVEKSLDAMFDPSPVERAAHATQDTYQQTRRSTAGRTGNAGHSNYYRGDAPFTARAAWCRTACTKAYAAQPGTGLASSSRIAVKGARAHEQCRAGTGAR